MTIRGQNKEIFRLNDFTAKVSCGKTAASEIQTTLYNIIIYAIAHEHENVVSRFSECLQCA